MVCNRCGRTTRDGERYAAVYLTRRAGLHAPCDDDAEFTGRVWCAACGVPAEYENNWSRAWTEVALGVALGALRALQDRHLRCGWSVLYPDGPEVAVTGILAAATPEVPDADD